MNFLFYRNVRVIEDKANILLYGSECVGKKTMATRLVANTCWITTCPSVSSLTNISR